MKTDTHHHRLFFKSLRSFGASLIGTLLAIFAWTSPAHAAEVIELTQVPCQFVEPEGGDKGFETKKKADCVTINAKNGEARVAAANVINLKPGDYIFRVTNKSVPYSLGFWLREFDYDWKNPLHKLNKISVSGGGMSMGKTLDYAVTLEPGEYLCGRQR